MLGETLKRLRGIYGYSAQELSECLGISKSYLSEIENGKKKASIDLLQKCADLFGLRLSTLLRFSEDYEEAYDNNAAQAFITGLMSKLINSYAIGSQVDSFD